MPPSQADRSFLTQVYKDLADEPLQPDNPFFEPVYELLGRDDPVQQIFTLIGAATRPGFGTYVKAVVPMLRGIGTRFGNHLPCRLAESPPDRIWVSPVLPAAHHVLNETEMAPPVPQAIRAGTRGSPLALVQTRNFLRLLGEGEEVIIATTGDAVQDRPLADIGGKGLFAKEIHEALLDRRIDCAVHSLKDLETELPSGIVLGCVLAREDARDVLILGETCGTPDPAEPLAALPRAALVGTSSVRRQAQLLHARPDLRVASIRGNVQTRLRKLRDGECQATTLALAGLRRLGMDVADAAILDPETMLPAAAQGIVGITIRAEDSALRDLLGKIEDPTSRAVATAERALLGALDGSCRTPIGAHARLLADGSLTLTGLVARADGSFLLRRIVTGAAADAARIGADLGASLRADAPADLFG